MAATRWVSHPDATIDEVIETSSITGAEDLMARVHLALGYEATRRRRIAAVVRLAEAGFRVRVHGEEAWREALAGTAAEGCWQGWMPAGPAQSAAFRDAGVALNVNSFAAENMLNMRSFEVPAAGGVLVSDDRPALRAAFDVGTEVLAFQGLDELPDLVGDVLRDRERRDAIAAAARVRVERDHSWDAWWAWAEKKLRTRFPSRK
jgi:spore maturation protein CgeB